jgi:excisionase family DNA binding protein
MFTDYQKRLIKNVVDYRIQHSSPEQKKQVINAEILKLAEGMNVSAGEVRAEYLNKEKPADPYGSYTVTEAANIIGVCRRAVNEYIKQGKIKATLVKGKWQIKEKHLQIFLENRKNFA